MDILRNKGYSTGIIGHLLTENKTIVFSKVKSSILPPPPKNHTCCCVRISFQETSSIFSKVVKHVS